MKQVGVYLAGGMKTGWQDTLITEVEREIPGEVWWIDPRSWADQHVDPASYTARDLRGIRDCSILLAWMDSKNPSGYGMCLEIGYAHAIGRSIIMADSMHDDWRNGYFGMARECADVRASSIRGAGSALVGIIRQRSQ